MAGDRGKAGLSDENLGGRYLMPMQNYFERMLEWGVCHKCHTLGGIIRRGVAEANGLWKSKGI
jgi:hypothetical protein